MTGIGDFPQAPPLQTQRLTLEPLWVDHADEMAPLLADPRLHEFTGGEPPSLEHLRETYVARVGAGITGGNRWCNWVLRVRESGVIVGGVQAEITFADDGFVAEIAWIVGCEHQRHGYGREAAGTMLMWLRAQGVGHIYGDIHARNEASIRLARALGLTPTEAAAERAGHVRWRA
jgi:RimJ/RimL family protein N-acetyltransferase